MKTQFTKAMAYGLLITATMMLSLFAKAQDEFKPSGKVTAQAFGDFYYKMHADSGNYQNGGTGGYHKGKTQYAGISYPQNLSAFDIRRVYLGYEYNFTANFKAQVVFAFEGDTDIFKNRIPYLKYANLQWTFCPLATLVVGAQPTVAFSQLEEKVYSYRSIEKTIMDMRGVASSNDVGAAIWGKFDKDANYGYDAMIGDGTGTKSEVNLNGLPAPTAPGGANIFRKFSGDLWAKFASKKIIVQVYGDYLRTQLQPFMMSTMTLKAFVAYQSDPITAGITVFQQTKQNSAVKAIVPVPTTAPFNDTTSVVPFGLSIFVRGQIIKDKLNFFARYDMWNPDNSYTTTDVYLAGANPTKESFITAGIDWMPIKNVHFMPNIWWDMYSKSATSALKTGTVSTTTYTGNKASDGEIVPRITFFWNLP